MKVAAELRLKHGNLYELAKRLGGCPNLAKEIGLGKQTVFKWLHMKSCPRPGVYNRWYTQEVEEKLESLSGMSAAELFPVELSEVVKILADKPNKLVTIRDIEPDQLQLLAESVSGRLAISTPETIAIEHETEERRREKLDDLMNEKLIPREKVVIQCRFMENLTLEETAHVLKVTRERVRQIEAKAMRKLKESSGALAEFMEG